MIASASRDAVAGKRLLLFLIVLVVPLALPGAPKKQAPQKPTGAPADAEYMGDEVCAGCHAEIATQFGVSPHGRLKPFELGAAGGRCESCHGPGSKHIEASGDPDRISGYRGAEALESARRCAACHASNTAMDWQGSEHAMSGVSCSQCHQVHQSRRVSTTPLARMLGRSGLTLAGQAAPPSRGSLWKPEPELCYDCHRDKKAQMNYTSHHPVREGRMGCSSCHGVHGGQSEHLLRNAESEKAFCTNCHPSKQGPFVFEHAAVEEGCNVCHNPHGAVADNLLKQNEPFLCLQCHEAHFHIGREGPTTPVTQPTGGSMNPFGLSGFRQAFATKCTQCHSQIHGSDLPSQSITSRGKALTR